MTDVRIVNASIEEDGDGTIIIRGVIDQNCLQAIHLDWYQREQGFSDRHTAAIVGALFAHDRIADITIGMRGHRCTSKDDVYILRDKCFCVDGGQRLYAAASSLMQRPDLTVRLGAKIYTGTTEAIELEMFKKLNTTQIKVSPSVLLRNEKKKNRAAALLFDLNRNSSFALKDRIGWGQRLSRHELISGFTFARVVGFLHAHKGGSLTTQKQEELFLALDNLLTSIGEESLQTNIIKFFDGIDKCWNIRNIANRRPASAQLNALFLRTIARLMSRYPDFWDGVGQDRNDFHFLDRHVKKLRGFKLAEYVESRASIKVDVLYETLRKRLNLAPIDETDIEEAVAA